jgi:hypothetical protein
LGTKSRRPARQQTPGYPTLDEHRSSRRRFLTGSAAVLGAGALASACGRPFWSDDHNDVDGGIELPDYHTIRFPAEPDDRAVWLIDGGFARFYAVALTFYEDCAVYAGNARDVICDLFHDEIAEHHFEELDSASGVAAIAGILRELLNQAYNDDTAQTGTDWFHELELRITHLEAPELLGGVPPATPSYP